MSDVHKYVKKHIWLSKDTFYIYLYTKLVVFHSLPQGNIVQLDHFCLNNIILMDGDVLGCIVITIIIFFAVLSTITHRKLMHGHSFGVRNKIEQN